MANPFELNEIPRSIMPLIFIVDTSSSMGGAKIGSLNTAIRESLVEVKDISASCADAQVAINALEFNTDVRWMNPAMVNAEQFVWQDMKAGGRTEFGAAVNELNSKLTNKEGGFINGAAGRLAPAIILLSDGEPTDSYKRNLQAIRDNRWFSKGTKVAIAIGDDANKEMLAEFTGTSEAVLTVHNIDQLKKIIRAVTVTVTTSGTTTRHAGEGGAIQSPQKTANDAIVQSVATDPTLAGVGLNATSGSGSKDDWSGWN